MAWVPTTSCASPLAMLANASRRSLAFWLPMSQTVRIPKGSSQPSSLRKCCCAKISVGAMSAHCQPESIHTAADNAATTVLPAPTSPCSRRCMGTWRAMSCAISSVTRAWALVSAKGKALSRRSCSASFSTCTMSCGATSRARSRRLCNCDSCCANSSSALSRCQAGWLWSCKVSSDTSGVGWCRNCSAPCSVHSRCASLKACRSPGSKVSDRSARASPARMALRSTVCDRPATVGYTGVSALGSSPSAARVCGCSMVQPMKPPLSSPRARMRLPTASAFCCEG